MVMLRHPYGRDGRGNLQPAYVPGATDRIECRSLIQGQISDGTGFFSDASLGNESDFTISDILSGIAWINGTHTNHSAYSRTQQLAHAEVQCQLDSELAMTDVTVNLGAADTFPESGTIERSLSGSYEQSTSTGQQTSQFNFHFIATYLGDNTAEVTLDDGTIFTVHLGSGAVEILEHRVKPNHQ
jgi:hypothetical protein